MKTTTSEWEKPYNIIGRGFSGWHADAPNLSSSGGNLDDYASQAAEGAFVYDVSHLEYTEPGDAFHSFVYRGPIVNPALPPDGISSFAGNPCSCLAQVGVERYAAMLRHAVPEGRYGRIRNGQVVWEETKPLAEQLPLALDAA